MSYLQSIITNDNESIRVAMEAAYARKEERTHLTSMDSILYGFYCMEWRALHYGVERTLDSILYGFYFREWRALHYGVERTHLTSMDIIWVLL